MVSNPSGVKGGTPVCTSRRFAGAEDRVPLTRSSAEARGRGAGLRGQRPRAHRRRDGEGMFEGEGNPAPSSGRPRGRKIPLYFTVGYCAREGDVDMEWKDPLTGLTRKELDDFESLKLKHPENLTFFDLSGKVEFDPGTYDPHDASTYEANLLIVPSCQLPYLKALFKAAALKKQPQGLRRPQQGRPRSGAKWIDEGANAMRPHADQRPRDWKPFVRLQSVQAEKQRRVRNGIKAHMAMRAMRATILDRLEAEKREVNV